MTRYFSPDLTQDEIREEYRMLCKEHHPDMGGDTATIDEIEKIHYEYAHDLADAGRALEFLDDVRDQFEEALTTS